jgi:hypothetical protein
MKCLVGDMVRVKNSLSDDVGTVLRLSGEALVDWGDGYRTIIDPIRLEVMCNNCLEMAADPEYSVECRDYGRDHSRLLLHRCTSCGERMRMVTGREGRE